MKEVLRERYKLYIIVWVLAMIIVASYTIGYLRGMEKMRDIQAEVQCHYDYDNKPASEITAGCLKYFK